MADIVLFGATGYTGRLTTAALVARGRRPVLAGRDPGKLDRLAAEHGGLPTRRADVADPASMRALVGAGDVLVSCVGPFARFGRPAVEAAIEAGAHYLDSTGEPVFIREVFERHGEAARERGVTLLTAFGYDYVPGHCAAGLAVREAGAGAAQLDIGYFFRGTADGSGMSQGTAASLLGAMAEPGVFFRRGRRRLGLGGTRLRRFEIGGRRVPAVSVPGSEQLDLPSRFPGLTGVEVYLGWFGAASYPMVALSWLQSALILVPGYRALWRHLAARRSSQGAGPSAEARAATGSRVVAIARGPRGQELARVDLVGVNGYDYTAGILAWGADRLASHGARAAGALGPLGAFDLDDLVEGNRQAGLAVEP